MFTGSEKPKFTGSWGSVFNLANAAIGAGVLSFPIAYKSLGFTGGAILCLTIAILDILTLSVLVKYSDLYKAQNYQGLVKQAFGFRMAIFNSFATLLMTFGALIAYLIIVGDTFSPIIAQYVFGHDSIWADRRIVILISSLVIVLPFSLQRHMRSLTGISSFAVAVMVYTGFVIFGKLLVGVRYHDKNVAIINGSVSQFKFDKESLRAVPIMIFAYQCHAQVPPIYHELDYNSTLLDFLAFSIFKFQQQKVGGTANESYNQIQSEIEMSPIIISKGSYQDQEKSKLSDQINANELKKVGQTDTKHQAKIPGKKKPRNLYAHPLTQTHYEMLTTQKDQDVLVVEVPDEDQPSPAEYNSRMKLRARQMYYIIYTAVFEMYVIYNIVGFSGYFLFGDSVQSNVIKNFGNSDVLIQVTRGLIGFAVIFHYPINVHVSRSALDSLRRLVCCEPWSDDVSYFRLVQNTLVIYVVTVGVAMLVKDLGVVFQIVGGTSASILCFIFPGLLLIKDSYKHIFNRDGRSQFMRLPQSDMEDSPQNSYDNSIHSGNQNNILNHDNNSSNNYSKQDNKNIENQDVQWEKQLKGSEAREKDDLNGEVGNERSEHLQLESKNQILNMRLNFVAGIIFIMLGILVTTITVVSIALNPKIQE